MKKLLKSYLVIYNHKTSLRQPKYIHPYTIKQNEEYEFICIVNIDIKYLFPTRIYAKTHPNGARSGFILKHQEKCIFVTTDYVCHPFGHKMGVPKRISRTKMQELSIIEWKKMMQ